MVTALLKWYSAHARDLPWRRKPCCKDPYCVWVSEIMLQQTQVKTVIPYWNRWMAELPDITALANAPEHQVLKLWEGLGYYTRVRNLHKSARIIQEKHAGRFPEKREEILALPGIGRYTAGAIASIAFNQPVPIVDGNVIRVLTRLDGLREEVDRSVLNRLWQRAAELVERAPDCSALNQSLMELGATLCAPRNPQCDRCPIRRHCAADKNKWVDEIPRLPSRKKTVPLHRMALIVKQQNRIFVSQEHEQSGPGRYAGLYRFPEFEMPETGAANPQALAKTINLKVRNAKPFKTVKVSVMHYRITLQACLVEYVTKPGPLPDGEWVDRERLRRLPMPAAHRRLANAVIEEVLHIH